MSNPTGKGGFQERKQHIWRKGRPKSFDALRELAQQIAHEEALSNGNPVVINGHVATVAEMILRQWAASKNPQLVKAFIEIAFGKVPDETRLTGPNGGPIQTEDVNLSDDERAKRITAILDKARARRAGQADSD